MPTFRTQVADATVEIVYDFSAGRPGSYFEPDEPPECDIQAILFEGLSTDKQKVKVDVSSLLDPDVCEVLAEACIEFERRNRN
ncbi:MAG: hypothetical protein ACK443_05860 [Methylococcaceae bacterium]